MTPTSLRSFAVGMTENGDPFMRFDRPDGSSETFMIPAREMRKLREALGGIINSPSVRKERVSETELVRYQRSTDHPGISWSVISQVERQLTFVALEERRQPIFELGLPIEDLRALIRDLGKALSAMQQDGGNA